MEKFDRSFEDSVQIIQEHLNKDRLTRFRAEYLALHNYEQARIFEALDQEGREKLYQYLSPTELADIFDYIESEDHQVSDYFNEMANPYAAAVLGDMYADNAADVLNQLNDPKQVNQYLQLMSPQRAREISGLVNYSEDTAGSIMTPEFISVIETWTLGEAYKHLRNQAITAESIYYVYVVDEHQRLVGVISLRDLIINDEDRLIKDAMNTRIISVQVTDDQEDVAKMVSDYDLLALPVVGFDRELLGIITIDDVLDVIQEEADSDYSGLAAVDVSEVHMTPISASKSRLPWLIALLFLGLGTATVIAQFDGLIEQVSVLSAFLTLITGTAGNAGTQALAVAIRKISNRDENDSFFKSITFELITGVITGLIVGIAIFLIVVVWLRNVTLGFVIGIAMFGAIVVANVAGAFIPKVMDRMGFDPAVASGPFISTLSDLTSVFIYFSIASLFINALI